MRDASGDILITEAARRLRVSCITLSHILRCSPGISADISLQLGAVPGTRDSMWQDMQRGHNMWKAKHRKQPEAQPVSQWNWPPVYRPLAQASPSVPNPVEISRRVFQVFISISATW